MHRQRATLRILLTALLALVRLLTGMSNPVLRQVLPGTEGLAAELAYLWFLTRVYSGMYPEVASAHLLAAYLAANDILACVFVHVLAEAGLVAGLVVTLLAAEAFSLLHIDVHELYMFLQINLVPEVLAALLARARIIVTQMRRHVDLQRLPQVKAFVADLTVLSKVTAVLLVHVGLQQRHRVALGVADLTHYVLAVRGRHVDLQVLRLLEDLAAFLAHRRLFLTVFVHLLQLHPSAYLSSMAGC